MICRATRASRGRLALAALVLANAAACRSPAGGAPGSAAAPEEPTRPNSALMRYGTGPQTLRLDAEFELNSLGNGPAISAKVDFVAKVAWQPVERGVKVVWNIEDVRDVELGGALAGQGEGDPSVFVREMGRGAFLTDPRGETDHLASDALPENAARDRRMAEIDAEVRASVEAGQWPKVPAGAHVVDLLPPIVQLPTLPEPELRVAEPYRVQRREDRAFGRLGPIPLEIETTYTLQRIEIEGEALVADLDFRGGARGESETSQGHLGIASTYEGRLRFDLNARRPVAYEVTRREAWQLGDTSGATQTQLSATWASP